MKKPVYERAALIIAQSIYPTAWGGDAVRYSPDSAASRGVMAVQALRKAGFKIVRAAND
jgi:hypothetical protein